MKTVLITGVGKGIGKAIAEKFLGEGFAVFGTFKSGTVSIAHENLSVFKLDLSEPKSIIECAENIAKRNVSIDILINNAGVLLDEEETSVVVDKLRQTLEINLLGTIDFTERILPLMANRGHIINISSTAGSLALAGHATEIASHYPYHYPAYKISKTALNMYTRTLSTQLESRNIIVSSVHPGWVKTDMGGEDADISTEDAAENIFKFSVSNPESGQFWFKGKKLPW